MDCRRSLQLACLCLVPFSSWLAAGCFTTTTQVVNPPQVVNQSAQVTADVKPDDEATKKKKHCASCVAGAEMLRIEANSPKYTQAQRDDFRERARKGYEQALRLDPKNAAAQLGMARLCLDTNDHDQAVAAYTKALKQNPKDLTLLYELGMVHARAKEWEKAVIQLKAAYDLAPDNKECASTLGHCLARAGRIDEALDVFRRSVGEAKAHYNVARMLHHMNQDDLCRQQLELSLRADPRLVEARDMLVQLGAKPSQTARQ
jgi:tetratricopeptide (TPR) repeat protein